MRQLEDLFSDFPLIASERLLLRQLTPEDAAGVFACESDPEVFRYSRRSEETSLESATQTLNILFKRHQERIMLCWAIVLKENQRFMGRIQMEEWSDEDHRAEVGYRLGKPYWGQGYATEALRAVVAYLFEQTTVNRIYASTWAENTASARVLEKAGMRFEGLSRQKRFAKGAFRDTKNYAILREDFFPEKGPPCIGYLDHPFEKEALGLSPPASFSWSGSTQPSKLRRMVPMDQRKQTWMGSRPSGKACTDCMRELQKTS